MGTFQLSIHGLAATLSVPQKFNFSSSSDDNSPRHKIRAVSTVPDSEFAVRTRKKSQLNHLLLILHLFMYTVLRSPDVHFRRACGGQKLRDTMLDNNITLSCMDHIGECRRPLLNCARGTCGTCMDLVEVVKGNELLKYRTDKEKEKLKMVVF
ncbi:hypothetical protein GQ457_09G006410 [Hibiscus cannabinus]